MEAAEGRAAHIHRLAEVAVRAFPEEVILRAAAPGLPVILQEAAGLVQAPERGLQAHQEVEDNKLHAV